MKILAIQRAEQFSPNSIGKDKAILEAVANRLRIKEHVVTMVSEASQWELSPSCDCIFTMGRLPKTLAKLKTFSGLRIINPPKGVENCIRSKLQSIMQRIGTPVPLTEGSNGFWLKRGDATAQSQEDVQFAADRQELDHKIRQFEAHGITNYMVSAHVVGDVVKFYGVRPSFFRYYYPADDGQFKFGDEHRNGESHHYTFDNQRLYHEVERIAMAAGVDVYGGDAIIRADGTFCIIDFNDWPSFSRCREEAAAAIASLIENSM